MSAIPAFDQSRLHTAVDKTNIFNQNHSLLLQNLREFLNIPELIAVPSSDKSCLYWCIKYSIFLQDNTARGLDILLSIKNLLKVSPKYADYYEILSTVEGYFNAYGTVQRINEC